MQRHENFHDNTVVVTLRMFPGLSVRSSGPAVWQVCYAIMQSLLAK